MTANYNCQSGRLLPLITVRTSYLFIGHKNVASHLFAYKVFDKNICYAFFRSGTFFYHCFITTTEYLKLQNYYIYYFKFRSFIQILGQIIVNSFDMLCVDNIFIDNN